jgi:hypothetical protein
VNSKISSTLFGVVAFLMGIGAFYAVYTGTTGKRDPAAIQGKVFQITTLTSEEIKNQLQNKIVVTPTFEGKKSIAFSGFSSALCKTYSSVEMEFAAEGISVAGEAPTMKITHPCEAAQDPAEMASISLPIEKILGEKPRNAEFSFDGYKAVVTFTNSADEWPRQWILKRVEFKTSNGENKSASFNRSPASVTEGEQPIVLEF